jgi:hypothetical protein
MARMPDSRFNTGAAELSRECGRLLEQQVTSSR